MGIIAGIPSWCIMLMERIVEHYKLNSIHEIWPNLYVYVHGGVYMEPYRQRLNAILSRPLDLLDTYLASEGYFGYQEETAQQGMKLLLNNGIFFEFIPFNTDNSRPSIFTFILKKLYTQIVLIHYIKMIVIELSTRY